MAYLGYGLLLKPLHPQRDRRDRAADRCRRLGHGAPGRGRCSGPSGSWSGLGFYFIAFFGVAFWLSAKRRFDRSPLFLRIALCSLPLPWVASELGWFVAEYGRQPWAIEGVLPTFLGASVLAYANQWLSLLGFVVFYSALAIVELFLMAKYIRLGPTVSPFRLRGRRFGSRPEPKSVTAAE